MTKFSTHKRRWVQSLRERAGLARDITRDPQFDVLQMEFKAIVEEMMEVGRITHQWLEQAKQWTGTSALLSEKLQQYFEGCPFHNTTSMLVTANDQVSGAIRKSVAVVLLEQCLNPLKQFCAETVPEIEARIANRNGLRKDYDSYRRRLRDLEGSNEPDRSKLDILRQKLESAQKQYEGTNAELIAEFTKLKASKQKLLEKQASALVVCQYEFFCRSTTALAQTLDELPGAIRMKTEKSVEQLVRSGGPDSSLTTSLIANRASFQIKSQNTPVQEDHQPLSNSSLHNSKRGMINVAHPNNARQSKRRNQPQSSPPPMPLTNRPRKTTAMAMHTFEARDETELALVAGDHIVVLEQDESGWWMGRNQKGDVGQFPSNYVIIEEAV
jgi:hypothetical protein